MSETLFKKVDYWMSKLMDDIEMGTIGLPDIQRPFVWKNSKVRDLFDSIFRGYPVGYFLFWQNAYDGSQKQIGSESKQKVPSLLIVDGQQRLMSLYAVVKGISVVRENYEQETIEIAFHPLDSSVSSLLRYPFTALELSSTIDEEQVAEVFVQINSKGKVLNQSDFILTLQMAGFRSSKMISSRTAIIYCYTFYLIGKKVFGIGSFALSTLISRWFFMELVTGRYTASPESAMERDLADIRDFTTADQLVQWMETTICTEFTDDFWNITLPNRMDTSSATSPYQFAYYASLNLLHAKGLFSNKKITDLLDPAHKANKSAVERHHLFPKKHLKKLRIMQTRITNQIANYALMAIYEISADKFRKIDETSLCRCFGR